MLGRLANGLFATAGAGILSQFPAYYAQYLQHLSGRLAQAREAIAPVAADAKARSLTVGEYLARAAQEGGELTGKLVEGYRSTFEALQRLEQAHAALREAGPLERPLAFVHHVEPRIAEAAFDGFATGLPLTPEGGGYMLIGLVLGVALLWTLERPAVIVVRRRRARRQAQDIARVKVPKATSKTPAETAPRAHEPHLTWPARGRDDDRHGEDSGSQRA